MKQNHCTSDSRGIGFAQLNMHIHLGYNYYACIWKKNM